MDDVVNDLKIRNVTTYRVSTPSPTTYVNSLSDDVPQVSTNLPRDEQNMETLFTRQIEILNWHVQMRKEHKGGLKSMGKAFKKLWGKKKK
ncbi:hypothetical protein Tco_0134385 [Tanacetum coccineum]